VAQSSGNYGRTAVIEADENLVNLLLEYEKDLDSPISVTMRRRSWIALAVLWYRFGGVQQMRDAVNTHNKVARNTQEIDVPCMSTKCPHGVDCTKERDEIEPLLMKFLFERSD
jgi:hypothetical protein